MLDNCYEPAKVAPSGTVVTRWDPNKSGNHERTETEWLVLGLGLEFTLTLTITLTNH